MTPEQFCYWLQGRAELMPDTPPTEAEWKMIADHLATVFKKVTPPLFPRGVIGFGPSPLGDAIAHKALPHPALDQFVVRC